MHQKYKCMHVKYAQSGICKKEKRKKREHEPVVMQEHVYNNNIAHT